MKKKTLTLYRESIRKLDTLEPLATAEMRERVGAGWKDWVKFSFDYCETIYKLSKVTNRVTSDVVLSNYQICQTNKAGICKKK